MAADPNLIKGAAMMYQNQMVGAASEGLQKGFEQSIQPYIDKIEENEKKAKLSEEQLGRMLNTLNSNVDGNGFTAAEQTIARNWAMSKRNEYADLAKQLSKMDYSDPNYSNVKAKLDGIKQSFENLRKNRDLLANGKKEFIEQQDSISAANRFFNPYNKEFAKIGDDGMIIYSSKDGEKRLSDTRFPELINNEGINELKSMTSRLLKLASSGVATKNAVEKAKQDMRVFLNQGNIVDSIIFDKLMPNLYKDNDVASKIEMYKRATGDAKQKVKDELIEEIMQSTIDDQLGIGRDIRRAALRDAASKRTKTTSNKSDAVSAFKRKLDSTQKATNSILSGLKLGQNSQKMIQVPIVKDGQYTGEFKQLPVRISADPTMVEGEAVYDKNTIRYEIKVAGSWNTLPMEEIAEYKIDQSLVDKDESEKDLFNSPFLPIQGGSLNEL